MAPVVNLNDKHDQLLGWHIDDPLNNLERRRVQTVVAGLLWTIIVILFIFWILGFAVWHLGAIIHIVIVVAIVLLIVNLLTGRGARL